MGSEIALFRLVTDAARQRYAESALPGAAIQPHRDRFVTLRRLVRGRRGRGPAGPWS